MEEAKPYVDKYGREHKMYKGKDGRDYEDCIDTSVSPIIEFFYHGDGKPIPWERTGPDGRTYHRTTETTITMQLTAAQGSVWENCCTWRPMRPEYESRQG